MSRLNDIVGVVVVVVVVVVEICTGMHEQAMLSPTKLHY
jgi:hypothetical protein